MEDRAELIKLRHQYRSGMLNSAADLPSRPPCCAILVDEHDLAKLHCVLCHPCVTRVYHFICVRNLPYSIGDVREATSGSQICRRCKLQCYKPEESQIIKVTSPFQRISVDFKGPLPSTSLNRYILIIVDEYPLFPFVCPCPNMTSEVVTRCFSHLFFILGNVLFCSL